MYSTHVAVPHVNPCWWFGCLLEVLADRNRGDTKHNQWRQTDGSIHITGAWIHVADIREAYEKNHVGTLRVCKPQLMLGLRALRPNYTLRDALEHVYAERTGAQFVEPLYSGQVKGVETRETVDI
jgi:hypothetical protein